MQVCYRIATEIYSSFSGNSSFLYLERVSSAVVDGDECEPDDAGRVHRETDELGLVEVLRNFPRLDRVVGAHCDQQHVVQLGDQERGVVDVALQDHLKDNMKWFSLAFSRS